MGFIERNQPQRWSFHKKSTSMMQFLQKKISHNDRVFTENSTLMMEFLQKRIQP
jgi:hypothetical protein